MAIAAAGGDAVRLVDGAWAVARPAGLWVGILEGEVAAGWRTHVGLLPVGALDAVRRALSTGGIVHGDGATLTVGSSGAVLDVEGAGPVVLGLRAAARLQVLSSMPAGTASDRTERWTVGMAVRARRGALEVDLAEIPPVGAAVGGVGAVHPGVVAVEVVPGDLILQPLHPVAAGTRPPPPALQVRRVRPVPLPALPLLLAAAEADRDDRDLVLHLRGGDGTVVSAELATGPTARAAADAQWLLPALLRRTV